MTDRIGHRLPLSKLLFDAAADDVPNRRLAIPNLTR